ncbi:MAG: nitrate/nitrite transporter NrtS [Leptolyngbyaceae cyanobacterium SM2_5_2]|nr:nitrate/nitrite transporter NrtS [Leptolyngbyaceae cyanobacterium SM2_5_2]
MTTPKTYWQSLKDPRFVPTALRVALVIGSLLFIINHGAALWQGTMTRQRWLSGLLTYIVPYCVSIHGQYTNQRQQD